MIPFEEALELCIEAVHQGTPVEDCLARYPEHALRLAPLLNVARELYTAPLAIMSETGFERQRARLRQGLKARHGLATNGHVAPGVLNGAGPNGASPNGASPNGVHPNGKVNGIAAPATRPPTIQHPPTKTPRWAGLFDWPRWATLTTQKAALMTVVALLAVAASLGGVTLASAKAAPDEPLYQVKRLVETVVDWIPAPAEAQASRALDRAEERLAESRAVCASDPMRGVELQQQMEQERQRAVRLVERLTSPTADGIRQRAQDMQARVAALQRECVAAATPPTPGADTAPLALPPLTPTPTDTLTPAPPAPVVGPSPAPTSVQAGVVSSVLTVEEPTPTATRRLVQSARPSALEPTRVPPTSVPPPPPPPPTATPVTPATATPAPSATPAPPTSPVPPPATPAPPATPTSAPTVEPTAPPTRTPPWTPIVEPTRTPIPTDEPRPTEPPPTLSPATPAPSVIAPPTPTLRVVEITKVPTQAPPTQPPPPTARPLEATATPGRPQPTEPPRPAPTEPPPGPTKTPKR